tara:strand:- start:1052 stop:2536 length:1485 start_codon:yes stop_codon:yes gene_type:complete
MWNEFARVNEEFIDMTPTQMVKYFDENPMDNTEEILNLWARNYPNNGAGESGLISRVAKRYGVDVDTIETLVEIHGGVGEAIETLFDEADGNRDITVSDVYSALHGQDMETVFTEIMDCFDNVNAMGKKWLAAFLLNQTRNKCGNNVVKKILQKTYGIPADDIKKAVSFLPIEDVIYQAVNNGALVYVPEAGNYMKPMLAKGGDFTVRNRRFCDYKYDGIRAQIHNSEEGITIFNRKGDDITSKFANDLVEVIKKNSDPVDWIADGEIYPIDADGNPAEFKNIMSRIHGKTDDVIYRNPVTIKLFDCMMYGGQPVFEDDLDTRWETLKMHFDNSLVAKMIEINSHEEMLEVYNDAIEAGFEGVIVKDPEMIYEFGARSKGWLKYKPPMVEVDAIITGATMGTGKRAGVYGAYDISIKDGDNLISVGKVGSGFTDSDLTFLTQEYNRLGAGNLIIEVKGDMLTKNESGDYGLRFPRYVKYRDDKEEPTQLKEILE